VNNPHVQYLVAAILEMVKRIGLWTDSTAYQRAMDMPNKVEAIKFLRSFFSCSSDIYNAMVLLKNKGATVTWPGDDEPTWLGLKDAKDLTELLWALKAFGSSEHMASLLKDKKYYYGRICRNCGAEFGFNEIDESTYQGNYNNSNLVTTIWEGHDALCIHSICPNCQ
jgi:hypothetical protein